MDAKRRMIVNFFKEKIEKAQHICLGHAFTTVRIAKALFEIPHYLDEKTHSHSMRLMRKKKEEKPPLRTIVK